MQEGIQNDVVVMDFAKAFDKVAHNRLFTNCHHMVKGNTSGWIGSFLSGRSQKVVLEGKDLGTTRHITNLAHSDSAHNKLGT